MIPIFLSYERSSARLQVLSHTLAHSQTLIISLAALSWRWPF